MRILALAILATATVSVAGPAAAQTYAGGPVCLHVYGPVTYYECRYASLAQCNVSASGRAAQCVINPYAANASMGPPARARKRLRLLLKLRDQSISTIWPSTSETRRSIRPANSIL